MKTVIKLNILGFLDLDRNSCLNVLRWYDDKKNHTQLPTPWWRVDRGLAITSSPLLASVAFIPLLRAVFGQTFLLRCRPSAKDEYQVAAVACFFYHQKKKIYIYIYMDVSENNGTPKSSILIGVSIINHPFWGTPIFGNTHMYPLSWLQATCSPCKINGFSWFLDGSVRVSLAHAPSFSDQVV